MRHKTISHVEVKSQDRGEVSAIFSTYHLRDSDNDVVLPGAFEDGASVLISSYQHTSWQGALPAGKGRIRSTHSEAVLDGQFFMDTSHGRDTFAVVKSLAESGLGEWSYGYDVLDSEPGEFDGQPVKFLRKVRVFEVSPVLRGAGVNTRTLAAKALMDPDEATELAAQEYVRYAQSELAWALAAELDPIRERVELAEIRAGLERTA